MKILKISKDIEKIINVIEIALKKGKVLILPTDTVYGLICNAQNKKAVEKIFKIKKRSFNKPIGIFVKDIEMAKKIAKISNDQEKLLKEKWPGKTTFILKKNHSENNSHSSFLANFVGTKTTIGIRIPDYQLINLLFKKIDFALVQTSANISDQPASVKINQVLKQFEDQEFKPDLVLNAGDLPESKSSVVIDLTTNQLKILRE